jgi:glycosyltransferase involved in cell wall biosynthesis
LKSKIEKEKINSLLKTINNDIDLYKKDKLTEGIQKSFSKPKITSLITSFNSEKYIKQAIRSVQNQKMIDVEILVVDDFSKDNSLEIIKELETNDKRIKVIRNKRNKGALYAKSIGIIKSTGKFIMILDSDDMFVNKDLFNLCFNEAIKESIDIIEFSGLWLYKDKFDLNGTLPKIPLYLRFKKNNDFVKQPQLSRFLYRSIEENKYKLIDGFLTGKCIKANVLKNTMKIIGKEIYNKKINYGDDRLINFLLFKRAKSFKFIKKFGYIYNYNNVSITHINKTDNNCHDELFNIEHIYKYTQFTNESEVVTYELFHRFKKILKPGLNTENLKYLYNLIRHILKNKYISNANKNKLINIINI